MNELVLDGCCPVPLAFYLKALGVLRLVAEQADPTVRGWWDGDRFRLRTTLDRDGLVQFFLRDYRPTPIIAPWNGGSGFYPKDAKKGIAALQTTNLSRFSAYREAIETGERLIRERKLSERPTDQAKGELIAALRAEGSADLVGWIDAVVALTLDRMAFPPLLGTGGNDGRLDFTNNFMQRLTELLLTDGCEPTAEATGGIEDALFAVSVAGLVSAAIGQFAPGAAGGPNSVAGFEGDPLVNRWDFVLMLEGAVAFAGGVSRRLEGADAAYLSYPFTVRAAAAGYGSASRDEQAEARGELWAPLWERAACYAEIRTLFREGRLSLGARPVRDGVDAARAVSALGVDRGIAGFERYGFVKRQGLAYLAAPLGRRRVEVNPRSGLLTDLDGNRWLDNLRRAAAGDAPAEFQGAVRRLEDCIFAVTERQDDAQRVQDLLIALGCAVRAVALRRKIQETLRPPPVLSRHWIEAADDGSPEFRLAVALTGMRARLAAGDHGDAASVRWFLPMRAHLGPLDPEIHMPQWSSEAGRTLAVWGAGPLVDNLCAVAQRRLLEQVRSGVVEVPFDSTFDSERKTPVAVDSGEIAAFLDGAVHDGRIAELLLGLAWVHPGAWSGGRHAAPLPFAYAAMKPLFTPRTVFDWLHRNGRLASEVPKLPLPPALPALLATGRVQEAVHLAQRRARASGLATPFFGWTPQGRANDLRFGRRLLAALSIPVRPSVVGACLARAYPTSDKESQDAA